MSQRELQAHLRLLRMLPGFLRDVIGYEEAVSTVKHRLATREETFLKTIDRTIFGNPGSPYRPLLDLADCGFEDIKSLVEQDGIEASLKQLEGAGVYVRFEEFKGRDPIVRQGREISVKAADFDNPLVRGHWQSRTSGSTGAPNPVDTDLAMIAALCHSFLLAYAAHGNVNVPTTVWSTPSGGSNPGLSEAKIGRFVDRWFSPVPPRELPRSSLAWATRLSVVATAKMFGVSLPRLESLPPDRAEVLARWAAGVVESRGRAVVQTSPSLAVRTCAAAKRLGIDLTGVTFNQSGEPTTNVKRSEINSVGATSTSFYATAESGVLGVPCARPTRGSDIHILSDFWALTTHPRRIPMSGASVNALVITGLHESSSKVMLNVETDDYGDVEIRQCGCLLGDLGYATHVTDIFSFSKLTSEGVTLVGNEMLDILERVLPERFGGTPLDYQLLEEEDEKGLTKVSIIVSPGVRIDDEQAVIDTVLEAMRPLKRGMDRAIFLEGSTLRVKRMNPIVTGRGNKLMPLYSTRNRGSKNNQR